MSQQGLGSECQGSGLPKVGHQWGLRVFIWGRFHLGSWNGIHKSDTVTLGRVGLLSSLPRCPYLPHRVKLLIWVQPGGYLPPLTPPPRPTGPADPMPGGAAGLSTRAWVTLVDGEALGHVSRSIAAVCAAGEIQLRTGKERGVSN